MYLPSVVSLLLVSLLIINCPFFFPQLLDICQSYSTLIQKQKTVAQVGTARDVLLKISQSSEVINFLSTYVPYDLKPGSVLPHTYYSTESLSVFLTEAPAGRDQFLELFDIQAPFATLLYHLMLYKEQTKHPPWKLSSFHNLMAGYAVTKKTDKDPDYRTLRSNRDFENYDGFTRNKLFFWMLLLQNFFQSPLTCVVDLVAKINTVATTGRTTSAEKDTALYKCISKIMYFGQLDYVRLGAKKSFGTEGHAVHLLALFADFVFCKNTLLETRRFLFKLPECKGDYASSYLPYAVSPKEMSFEPLNQKKIDTADITFLKQMFQNPARAIYESLKTPITAINVAAMADMDGINQAQRQLRTAHKFFRPLLLREVNTAWMKIANLVGSWVHTTKDCCPGEST